jgi:hypothetical protein
LHEIIHNIRSGFSFFDKSDLKKIWGLSAICFVFFIVFANPRGISPLSILFCAAYYIAWLLGTGLPIIIIAAQLFGSKLTKTKIVDAEAEKKLNNFLYLFLPYLIITLLIMSAGVIAGYCFIVFSSGVFEALVYTPQLLASTLFLTLLVSPMCLLLSLMLDDKKLSIAIGTALLLILTLTTGTPGFPMNYAELSFLGPSTLFIAIVFILFSAFENPYSAEFYVGLRFSATQLIIPLLVWISLSIASTWAARRFYSLNIRRWIEESNQWISVDTGDDSLPASIKLLYDKLKYRRKAVIVFSLAFLFIVPIGSMGYMALRQNEWTKIVYESPPEGETVQIGEWLYGAFTGTNPPENIGLCVECDGQILEGGGSTNYVQVNFNHRQMSLNELQQMNETELEDMFGRQRSGSYRIDSTFSTGCGGPIHEEQYIWILRFLDVHGRTEGTIRVSFRVFIRAY